MHVQDDYNYKVNLPTDSRSIAHVICYVVCVEIKPFGKLWLVHIDAYENKFSLHNHGTCHTVGCWCERHGESKSNFHRPILWFTPFRINLTIEYIACIITKPCLCLMNTIPRFTSIGCFWWHILTWVDLIYRNMAWSCIKICQTRTIVGHVTVSLHISRSC